ncbi:hypothetical protein C8R44DRAFT_877152 [Mycena epipterygia]|nr:hypothetical protein C8R44DRAFT_877152 [Mycena epipterygia]
MHADPVFTPLQLKCEIMDPEFTETPFHIDSLVFVAPLPESQFKGDGQETVPDSGVGSVVNDIATKPRFDIKRRIYPALWSFLVSISGYAPFIFSTEIDGIATATDSQSIKRLVIYTATYHTVISKYWITYLKDRQTTAFFDQKFYPGHGFDVVKHLGAEHIQERTRAAVRIKLTNLGATVTLVNAHLAAFDEMFEKWNTNFHDLAKCLQFNLNPSVPT